MSPLIKGWSKSCFAPTKFCSRGGKAFVTCVMRSRTATIFAVLLMRCGEQLAQDHAIPFSLSVVGEPPRIDPTICREMYYIGREAISNAFQHSHAAKIEATISYEAVCGGIDGA